MPCDSFQPCPYFLVSSSSNRLGSIQYRHSFAHCRLVAEKAGDVLPVKAFRANRLIDGLRMFPVFFGRNGQPDILPVKLGRHGEQIQLEKLRPRSNVASRRTTFASIGRVPVGSKQRVGSAPFGKQSHI
jgi:hypothetical protein